MDFEQDNAAEWDVPHSHRLLHKDHPTQDRAKLSISSDIPSRIDTNQAHTTTSSSSRVGVARRVGPGRKVLAQTGTKEGKWPKVRPQNDWTGKEYEKSRREERKRFAELSRKQGSDDVYGNKVRLHGQVAKARLTAVQGVFLLHGYQIEPEIVMNLLQDLRTTLKCRVQLDQDKGVIEVFADDFSLIQKALRSIRGKITGASSSDNRRLIIVDRPGDGVNIAETELRMTDAGSHDAKPKAAGLNTTPKNGKRPEMVPCIVPVESQSNVSNDENERLRRNPIALRLFINNALGRLRYRHGFVQMRVNFGALIFHRFQWPLERDRHPSEVFVESLRNPRTELSLYKLTSENNLYEKIGKATDFLSPWSSKINHINQTTPFFVGRFVWLRDKENKPPWIFEAVTEPIEAEAWKQPSIKSRDWLQPSYPGSCRELEIFVTQLNGGVSCAFEINSEPHTSEKIVYPRKLTAQDVRMVPTENFVDAASKGLLVFDPRPSNCHRYHQRTVWRFRLSLDQRYILELIRYDGYHIIKESLLRREPVETRWDAVVYNEDWDYIFAGNKMPDPEVGAGWNPSSDTFFPSLDRGQGSGNGIEVFFSWIRDFMDCLNREERTLMSL